MTPDPTPDPATAELERIRERHAARTKTDVGIGADPEDATRLLAAVEAVLKEAGDFEANRPERLVPRSYAAECFRAAITRELTGKDPDHA